MLDGRRGLDFRLDLIARAPLFRGLPPEVHRDLAAAVAERRASRRQRLVEQGEAARDVLVLCAGRLKITQLAPNGGEVIVRLVAPGEAFGGLGLARGAAYPSSAEALERSHAFAWDRARIDTIGEHHPVLLRNVVRILSERLRETERRHTELATERVPQRLAHLLLRLVGHVGRPEAGGVLVALSREELAQMAATTLFTVSRILVQWQARGIVQARREAVVVTSADRLVGVADEREATGEPGRTGTGER